MEYRGVDVDTASLRALPAVLAEINFGYRPDNDEYEAIRALSEALIYREDGETPSASKALVRHAREIGV